MCIMGGGNMIGIMKLISSAFAGTTHEQDTLFPVLMFTIVSLLLINALVLAGGAPPFSELEPF